MVIGKTVLFTYLYQEKYHPTEVESPIFIDLTLDEDKEPEQPSLNEPRSDESESSNFIDLTLDEDEGPEQPLVNERNDGEQRGRYEKREIHIHEEEDHVV